MARRVCVKQEISRLGTEDARGHLGPALPLLSNAVITDHS